MPCSSLGFQPSRCLVVMPPVFACSQGRGAKIGAADALSKFGSMRKLAKKERQPIVAYRYLQLRHRYVTVTLLLRYHTVTLPFQEREPELLPLEACIKLSNRRGVRTCHPPRPTAHIHTASHGPHVCI